MGLQRRSSVSSSGSSIHSGSGVSDWDDNVSGYSSGSGPPTSFNSPNVATFPLSTDGQSPPLREGAIRLPNAPLSDIASLQQQQGSPPSHGNNDPNDYFRRGAIPEMRTPPLGQPQEVPAQPFIGGASADPNAGQGGWQGGDGKQLDGE